MEPISRGLPDLPAVTLLAALQRLLGPQEVYFTWRVWPERADLPAVIQSLLAASRCQFHSLRATCLLAEKAQSCDDLLQSLRM